MASGIAIASNPSKLSKRRHPPRLQRLFPKCRLLNLSPDFNLAVAADVRRRIAMSDQWTPPPYVGGYNIVVRLSRQSLRNRPSPAGQTRSRRLRVSGRPFDAG